MDFTFLNKKSEKNYNNLLKKDKNGDFLKYFNNIKNKKTFYSSNGIPDNCFISLIAFQAIEFYLKYDKKQMKSIFKKFCKLAANNNKEKYYKLTIETNKIINDMIKNKYTFSSNTMIDFVFEIDQKIIKSVKIFLDVVGNGIYRIGYNIYLQDEYYYKYWQIAVKNFENLLLIKKWPFINCGKIKILDGNNRKSQELIKLQNTIKNNIYKLIKSIAPGIFVSLYNCVPIIMVLETGLVSYYNKIGNYLFEFTNQEENLNNSFWEIIRKDRVDILKDFYFNRTYSDMYIPSLIEDYTKPIIFSKHFRNRNAFTPTNLLFVLEVLNIFYIIQLNSTINLKNNYLFGVIKSKLLLLFPSSKKIDKVDALKKLLTEAFKIEERKYRNPYNEKLKYYLNNSYDYEIEYFGSYLSNIKMKQKLLEKNIPELKNIYYKIQNDKNNISNIVFQIIGLLLAIFMALFTIQQCEGINQNNNNIKENKCIENDLLFVRQEGTSHNKR